MESFIGCAMTLMVLVSPNTDVDKAKLVYENSRLKSNYFLQAAVISMESSWNEKAMNTKAVGLMQVLPSTAKWLYESKRDYCELDYHHSRLAYIEANVQYGTCYLKVIKSVLGNDPKKVLKAYHAGIRGTHAGVLTDRYINKGIKFISYCEGGIR